MLPDKDRTKEQLMSELAGLRQRVAELEILEAERRKAEIPLLGSEEYQRLFELSPMGITVLDMKGVITACNSAVYMESGYSKDDFIGKYFSKVATIRAGDIPKFIKIFASLIRGRVPKPLEVMYIRKDGTTGWTETHISLLKLSGKKIGIQVIQNDITERKQTEEKIQQQNEFLSNILESLRYPFYVVDANDYTIQMANSTAKAGNLSERPTCHVIAHKSSKPCRSVEHPCPLEEIKKTKKPAVMEHIHYDEDGNVKHVEVHGYPIVDTEGNVIQMIEYCIDITERKEAENALRASEERFRNLIENAPIGIAIATPEGHVLEMNKARLAITGYDSKEEYSRKTISERYYDPKDREHWIALLQEKGKLEGFEVRLKRKDGTLYWVSMNSMPLISDSEERQYMVVTQDITERKQAEEALRKSEKKYKSLITHVKLGIFRSTPEPTGKFLEVNPALEEITGYSRKELLQMNVSDLYVYPQERELVLEEVASGRGKTTKEVRFRKKDGTEIVVFDRKVVVRDDTGNILYFDGILEDITERKQAEEREKELQQELNLSSRLAAVGELAAGVAHEINNPLTGVLGFSGRLLRKSTDEEIRRDLERIHSEAQRMVKVMDNLRTFTRRREPEKQYSDINDTLHETLELRAYELRTGNIEVVTDFAPSLPEIEVDPHQIQEVFLNIILNAEQVMTEAHTKGKLTIKTGKIKDYVRISFADDGPGIPAEHLDKLFDPFFTTRGEKGGTGLGLSVCHSIVAGHGGRLYAKSKPGEGAMFFVELPCS